MEGDLPNVIFRKSGALHFNPLPPHGGRLGKVLFVEFVSLFQSTPSAWRETWHIWTTDHSFPEFQSTPSAWRETTSKIILHQPFQPISIHSLRMEGDRRYAGLRSDTGYFNPLPPHGGRPVQTLQRKKSVSYFNPLPPHGGRLDRCKTSIKYKMEFQSTPSAWRETLLSTTIFPHNLFQSTPSAWRETQGDGRCNQL